MSALSQDTKAIRGMMKAATSPATTGLNAKPSTRSDRTSVMTADIKLPPSLGRPTTGPSTGPSTGPAAAPEKQVDIKADTVKASQSATAAVVAALLPSGLSNASALQSMEAKFGKLVVPQVDRPEIKMALRSEVRANDRAATELQETLRTRTALTLPQARPTAPSVAALAALNATTSRNNA